LSDPPSNLRVSSSQQDLSKQRPHTNTAQHHRTTLRAYDGPSSQTKVSIFKENKRNHAPKKTQPNLHTCINSSSSIAKTNPRKAKENEGKFSAWWGDVEHKKNKKAKFVRKETRKWQKERANLHNRTIKITRPGFSCRPHFSALLQH